MRQSLAAVGDKLVFADRGVLFQPVWIIFLLCFLPLAPWTEIRPDGVPVLSLTCHSIVWFGGTMFFIALATVCNCCQYEALARYAPEYGPSGVQAKQACCLFLVTPAGIAFLLLLEHGPDKILPVAA